MYRGYPRVWPTIHWAVFAQWSHVTDWQQHHIKPRLLQPSNSLAATTKTATDQQSKWVSIPGHRKTSDTRWQGPHRWFRHENGRVAAFCNWFTLQSLWNFLTLYMTQFWRNVGKILSSLKYWTDRCTLKLSSDTIKWIKICQRAHVSYLTTMKTHNEKTPKHDSDWHWQTAVEQR